MLRNWPMIEICFARVGVDHIDDPESHLQSGELTGELDADEQQQDREAQDHPHHGLGEHHQDVGDQSIRHIQTTVCHHREGHERRP